MLDKVRRNFGRDAFLEMIEPIQLKRKEPWIQRALHIGIRG